MMWYADLSPCTYFGTDAGVTLRAVGWLERGHEYPVGGGNPDVYRKLTSLCREPWQPAIALGSHRCDLCQFEAAATGSANLFIPANGFLYVCPELITHYMNAHGYLPPHEFAAAVLACPEMRSVAYLKCILENGGRQLLATPSPATS